MRTHSFRRRIFYSRQSGVSLLESLVALLVLALGVLGMLGVQLKSLSDNQSATQRAIAIRLAEDLFERIQANPQGLKDPGTGSGLDFYDRNSAWTAISTPAQNCVTNPCSAQQQAAFDLWRWQTTVRETLPGGNATTFISPSDTEQLGVMVAWRLRQTDQSTTTTANDQRAAWLNVDVANGAACPANSACMVAYGKP